MNFDRTKNASRNIAYGMIQRIYQMVVPFAMRTAMIYWLGMEYTGLDGLFTSILSVLNLAELGVGSAMVYSMYKPVAEDDEQKVMALMKLYRFYYRCIGGVVLIAGVCLCPFLPKLIYGSIPDGLNIYVLFLLNLSATVLSYWLFAYKNSLLHAYQRVDIVSKVSLGVNTVRYLIQFVVLFLFHNYYLYLIVTLASQAGINIATALAADRMFPNLKPCGKIATEEQKTINHRIRDLFTAKIGSVIVNSVDTLVVSAFLGLTVLAIYQNYYYIITALLSIINIFIFSCTAGIGNSIIVDTKEKTYTDFKTFTFLIASLSIVTTSCLVCMYQPFMVLWVGEERMFAFPAVVCFGLYFFIVQINTLLNAYKDAAGIWHEDRFRPLITAIANLTMNLIMVRFWGIYGILLSTVLSMLIVGMPWLVHNLFTTLFRKQHMPEYAGMLLKYALAAAVIVAATVLATNLLPFKGVVGLALKGIVCAVISGMAVLLLFGRTQEFKNAVVVVDRITRNKLHLQKLLIR